MLDFPLPVAADWPGPWPPDTVLPDYGEGGLYGLVRALAARTRKTPPVVLCLIDGLGEHFLQTCGEGSRLAARPRGVLTSVFPSTTASAIGTVMSGLPPAGHGLLGWLIRDRRFGGPQGILAPLPLKIRGGGPVRGLAHLSRLFPYPTLFQRLAVEAHIVAPRQLVDSPFNLRHSRGAVSRVGYDGLDGMVAALEALAPSLREGAFAYAYYAEFDHLAHQHGPGGGPVRAEFARIDRALDRLAASLARHGVGLVVTADHGFVEAGPQRCLDWSALPCAGMVEGWLWGEPRAAFCRLRPGAAAEFDAAAGEALAGHGVVRDSQALLALGVFGPPPHCRRIGERIGDRMLLMAPGWTLSDRLPSEPATMLAGMHGGLSAQEMQVPLIGF